ncbi:MAG: GNAT family N-acetyltransferase [Cyclobacteriaceae bacterium]
MASEFIDIRFATNEDIPSVVHLLKLSLGESLMPKSEAFWRWKHKGNPFGESPVLLAFDESRLVGVRAFMRWDWKQREKIIRSVRAVDTATHPDYQGKGIFRRLTLKLVDQCKIDGIDFIFNTPNSSSMPGYLRMGWRKVGRMPVGFRPHLPKITGVENNPGEYGWDSCYIASFLADTEPSEYLATKYTREYFDWRYDENPNVTYHLLRGNSGNFFAIFRIRPFRFGLEMRICEVVANQKLRSREFNSELSRCATDFGVNLMTFSGSSLPLKMLKLNAGPVVTINTLNTGTSVNFENWKPSLGDMELF